MQQFLTLMKYKTIFCVLYDSQFRFEISEFLLRLWSGQAKRNRVFWNQEAWVLFHSLKKKGDWEREGGKRALFLCLIEK